MKYYLILPEHRALPDPRETPADWPASPSGDMRQGPPGSLYPDYEQLRAVTGPALNGWFEHVRVLFEGAAADMLVDEDGLLKRLPPNPVASEYYYTTHPRDTVIVGPALLFTGRILF